MKYKIVLQESEEGFAVSCPGLPGCWSQGDTEEEAVANIKDAITNYLAVIMEMTQGQVIREVEVAAASCPDRMKIVFGERNHARFADP